MVPAISSRTVLKTGTAGDGMATSMISAARLLAHKTINGKYQSK